MTMVKLDLSCRCNLVNRTLLNIHGVNVLFFKMSKLQLLQSELQMIKCRIDSRKYLERNIFIARLLRTQDSTHEYYSLILISRTLISQNLSRKKKLTCYLKLITIDQIALRHRTLVY